MKQTIYMPTPETEHVMTAHLKELSEKIPGVTVPFQIDSFFVDGEYFKTHIAHFKDGECLSITPHSPDLDLFKSIVNNRAALLKANPCAGVLLDDYSLELLNARILNNH